MRESGETADHRIVSHAKNKIIIAKVYTNNMANMNDMKNNRANAGEALRPADISELVFV